MGRSASKSKTSLMPWLYFSLAYLSSAKILFEAQIKLIEDDPENKPEEILLYCFPAIYSIKHALELIFKACEIEIDNQYLLEHDLGVVHENFIKKFNVALAKKKTTFDQQKIEKLAGLVEKYLWNRFLEKCTDGTITGIRDVQNDLFRYPESKVGMVSISLFKNFGVKELEEVIKDIEDIVELSIDLTDKLFNLRIQGIEKLTSNISESKI